MVGARRLQAVVQPGDAILIATGFPSRSFLREGVTETDGPIGAAVLARALEQCLEVVPLFVTDSRLTHYLDVCGTAAGLIRASEEQALRSKHGQPTASAFAVIPFPASEDEAVAAAPALLERTQAPAVVSIELPGKNADGHYYTAKGREIDAQFVVRADTLFAEAKARNLLTVGVGDNGNEVGMGAIRDAVLTLSPIAERYAAATAADVLVAGTNSNWGAYALAASIAAVTRRTDVLPQIDVVRIIEVCAQAGAIDGISSRPEPRVDGTPATMNEWIVALMQTVIEGALRHAERPS